MKTFKDFIIYASKYLEARGVAFAKREAEFLCSLLLKRPLSTLYYENIWDEKKEKICQNALQRRGNREPLAYILGEVPFLECTIEVNGSVLIPRQETEILADKVAKHLRKAKVVLDLCTGSGCIGISLKKRFPHLELYASDISSQALKVAQKNAENNGVFVHFLQGDFLAPFKGKLADVIVCNPPYVSEEEFCDLDEEVKNFEPTVALKAKKRGYEFYERLVKEVGMYLQEKGVLWLEIGKDQKEKIEKMFQSPCWHFSCEKDFSGLDRFVCLRYKKHSF